MSRDISIYLTDILTYMEYAEEFTKGKKEKEFLKDRKTSFAVLRCIEVIGEATKHIPEEIRDKYPSIPWKDIAGMRDKVIHFYSGVNYQKVWLVIKEDIPKLKPEIKKILNGK